MKLSFLFAIMAFLFCGTMFTVSAKAQGVIVPIICDVRPCRPPRPTPRPVPLPNALPVKSIKIEADINKQVVVTHIEQVFRNDTSHILEGTYFFPIPDDASIVEFAIWENGKRLVGEVRSREEARKIYEEIVRTQRDPGLLEYAGKNLMQATIFPIPPRSDKKLEIKYSQILKADSGTVAYKYPLGTGRNIWRARNLGSEVKQTFGTVSGIIRINGDRMLRNVYSPTHSINVDKRGENSAAVSFETTDNDSDFSLFYGIDNKELGMSLLTYREPGKDGYFLLMMSPRDDISDKEVVSKDIVFVLDTSGSMADAGKMDKAKAALLFGIRTLREGDRFNVISFAGQERLMESRLIKADAHGKRLGENFIQGLSPSGGTNINDTLIEALKQFDNSDRPKILVFMTDGRPTVSEINEARILANFKNAKKIDVRLFPFGFGYDVNTNLLDNLGSENSGLSDYVQPTEDIEVKVSNFFTRVSSPVLSDVELDFGQINTEYVFPRKPGDIFKGMQVSVIGRYKNEKDLRNIEILLKGKTGQELKTTRYTNLNFPLRSNENDFLPRLWASRRVGWLVEQIRANGETKELKDEVIELGTRYGIVTPYTSYLATDGTMVGTTRGSDGRQMVAPTAMRRVQERSGQDAVQMSITQNAMKANVSVSVSDNDTRPENQVILKRSEQTQFVANRNFYYEKEAWIDSEVREDSKLPKDTFKFASEEYFKLILKEPGLAPYLSLGEQVTILWKGRVIEIVAE